MRSAVSGAQAAHGRRGAGRLALLSSIGACSGATSFMRASSLVTRAAFVTRQPAHAFPPADQRGPHL